MSAFIAGRFLQFIGLYKANESIPYCAFLELLAEKHKDVFAFFVENYALCRSYMMSRNARI